VGTRLSDFRENPNRAIFVTGEIDEKLVHRLTPELCRLRAESSEPITAYIDSRGGSTLAADHLFALFKTPTQDGAVSRLITVAATRAASAAADLLALGDYAIAYPHAIVHFHGTRLSADEITRESAQNLAASLREANEEFALRLAKRVFGRIAFHYTIVRGEFPKIREQALKENWDSPMGSDLECFACAIHGKLSRGSRGPRQLPQRAYKLHEDLAKMSTYVFEKLRKVDPSQPFLETEAEILRHLLDYELANREKSEWSLVEGGIDILADDFRNLADFIFGRHKQALQEHIENFGVLFLDSEQTAKLQEERELGKNDSMKWLDGVVRPTIEPLWYFVVALCRLLQHGENPLTATDAYWLGLVDEVVGQKLPSLRLVAENPDV
jgi:ATP-dependent protease ClpP protease subunit